jgi:hypothetical protein
MFVWFISSIKMLKVVKNRVAKVCELLSVKIIVIFVDGLMGETIRSDLG